MIQLTNSNDVEYLVGGETTSIRPIIPYDDEVCSFLNDLSTTLRTSKKANSYSDIITFAFWCRKTNILKQNHALMKYIDSINQYQTQVYFTAQHHSNLSPMKLSMKSPRYTTNWYELPSVN